MASISLDNADVWDDSALIRSWDQALDEYKARDKLGKEHGLNANRYLRSTTAFMLVEKRSIWY